VSIATHVLQTQKKAYKREKKKQREYNGNIQASTIHKALFEQVEFRPHESYATMHVIINQTNN